MTPGIYALVSGVTARWRKQDSHAINLSGASTIGQKRLIAAFSSFDQALDHAQKTSAPLKAGASIASITTRPSTFDWSNGPLKQTGETLDFAIQGPGFFEVQTPTGKSLTRDGHFQLDASNQLVTSQGYRVLGPSGPLSLPSRNVTVGPDGRLSVNGSNAGSLNLVMPEKPEQLRSDEGTYFTFGDAKMAPASSATLKQGMLEESNVELPKEMVGMIQNQRMADMLSRAIQTQDEGMGRAIQELGTV